MQAVGTQPAVPREVHFPRAAADQVGTEGLTEQADAGVGEFGVGDAANIVFAKNVG